MSAGLRRGGRPFESSHWLVGSDSVRAVQSSGKTVSRDESCPTPNRYPSSQQIHGREEKHREKEKKTQKQERFSLVRKNNKRRTIQTDDGVTTRRRGGLDIIALHYIGLRNAQRAPPH